MSICSHGRTRGVIGILSLALASTFSLPASTALANRFGPPWQARVTADASTLYSAPDRASAVVGPLPRGAIVVVVGPTTGYGTAGSAAAQDAPWLQLPDGWLRASDIAEDYSPWIAEVSAPSVSIYARPNAAEPIRRTARAGDLLRVTGVSPGIDGDTGTWWSTTEGYVGLRTLRTATSEWAASWSLPEASAAGAGWWGTIRSQANVRAAPTTRAPIVGGLVGGERVKVLGEVDGDAVSGNASWYRIDGGRYAGAVVHSSLIDRGPEPRVVAATRPADAPPNVGTIAVSRASSTLTYYDRSSTPVFTTYVSLGRAGVDTPEGQYATSGKYRFDNMSSLTVADADHAYHLPNVPFVQYYKDGGYAIHSTYWHDRFGSVESQGCINVTWSDGGFLFSLTQPTVADGDVARWAVGTQVSTPVVITP